MSLILKSGNGTVARRKNGVKKSYGRRKWGKAFIPKSLAKARYQHTDKLVLYFKRTVVLNTDADGKSQNAFNSQALYTDTANWAQFNALKRYWDRYKVLSMQVKYQPTFTGSVDMNKGMFSVWSDQRADQTLYPLNFNQICNDSSFKIINPNKSYTRTLNRASGDPGWGHTVATANADPWQGVILFFIQNAEPDQGGLSDAPTLGIISWCCKVVFEGRNSN